MSAQNRKYAICVSTTRPSSSLTPGGGGGSMTILCPHTGSVFSTLRSSGDNRGKYPLGVSTMSCFPSQFSADNDSSNTLLMAYGGTSNKKEDTYGLLVSLRSASLPPILHWKCRLPEATMSAGLSVSPCGHYIAGGSSSGSCFVWTSMGGELWRSFKAHYRAVTVLQWSQCGRYLVTGGADGIIHLFSLLELVDLDSTSSTPSPLRTWSVHHLPVTCIAHLHCGGGRIASASQDGQIVLFDLFSEEIVASLQIPHGVRSLTTSLGRLYAGTEQGAIYLVDLDAYAVHQSSQLSGGNVASVARQSVAPSSTEEIVFGTDESMYKMELRGHERPVSALAIVQDDDQELLVSGDEGGTLRVWVSRSCVRVLHPWSVMSGGSGKAAESSASHPITSILVVPREEDRSPASLFGPDRGGSSSSNKKKGQVRIPNLIKPLQKFLVAKNLGEQKVTLSSLQPRRDSRSLTYLDVAPRDIYSRLKRKREKGQQPDNSAIKLKQQESEVARLQQELAEAKSTIQRWETVNNKLIAKLEESR